MSWTWNLNSIFSNGILHILSNSVTWTITTPPPPRIVCKLCTYSFVSQRLTSSYQWQIIAKNRGTIIEKETSFNSTLLITNCIKRVDEKMKWFLRMKKKYLGIVLLDLLTELYWEIQKILYAREKDIQIHFYIFTALVLTIQETKNFGTCQFFESSTRDRDWSWKNAGPFFLSYFAHGTVL